MKFEDVVLENLYQIIDIDNSSLITIHFPALEINGQIFPQTNNINLLENTVYNIEVYSYTEENKQILTPINNDIKFRTEDIAGFEKVQTIFNSSIAPLNPKLGDH